MPLPAAIDQGSWLWLFDLVITGYLTIVSLSWDTNERHHSQIVGLPALRRRPPASQLRLLSAPIGYL